jgi:hypothetical protein
MGWFSIGSRREPLRREIIANRRRRRAGPMLARPHSPLLFFIAFVALAGLTLAARAAMVAGAFMGHNGSTIQELTDNDKVEYRYSSVRAGLPAKQGDVLFRGTKQPSRNSPHVAYELQGTAYTFKRDCPPAGYEVRGEQTSTRVMLRGAAPRHAADSCAVIGYDSNGANATLVFDIAE